MKYILKQLSIFLSAAVLLSFISCNNLTQSTKQKSNQVAAEYAYITIGVNTSSARDIFPDLSLNNLTYTLKGKWGDQTTEQNLASGTWSQISTNQIELQTGEWQFTLTAVHTTTSKTFTATLNTTVTASTTSLDFTLHADENKGDFSVSVNITKPANFSTDTNIIVSFTLKQGGTTKFNPDSQIFTDTAITFAPETSYSFDPGDYDMEINLIASDLYDSESNKIVLNTYKDKLHVVAGFNTTKELSLNVNPVYDISYEYHDGTISVGQEGPAKFSRKSVTAPLPTLTKDYYTFLGWFSDDTDGDQYEEVSVTSRTYYARFTPTEYSITWNLPEGIDEDDIEVEEGKTLYATYTVETEDYTLPSISMDGYYFGGWFNNATFTGSPVTSISQGSHGSVPLYACLIDTLYVTNGGGSTNTGYNTTNGLDSLASAITKIQGFYASDNTNGNINWNIQVFGSLVGCQTITIENAIAQSISIMGCGSAQTITGNTTNLGDGSTLTIDVSADVPIVLTDLIITGGSGTLENTSDYFGGGIYLKQGTLKLGDGVKITGNTIGTMTDNGYGGGVYLMPGTNLYVYGSACIGDPEMDAAPEEAASGTNPDPSTYANFARYGGGVYNKGNVYLGYSSYTDEDHYTEETLGNGIIGNYSQYGGGLYSFTLNESRAATVVMNSGNIFYNLGSGVENNYQGSYKSTFTLNGGNICYNKSGSSSAGGGVNNASSFVMNDGAINYNTAGTTGGGGVYNTVTFVMNGGEISHNTIDENLDPGTNYAQCNGGGVHHTTGTFTMNDGTITQNSAPHGRGGGVYTEGFSGSGTNYFTINGGVVSENTAVYGGGIYNAGLLKLAGSVYIPAGIDDANDLALVKYNSNQNCGFVYINGTLTPPTEANGLVAKITPMDHATSQSKDWFTDGLILFRGEGCLIHDSRPTDCIYESWEMKDVDKALCHFQMSSRVPEKYQNCIVSRNGFLKKGYNITSSTNYSDMISSLADDGTYYLNYQGTLNAEILTSLASAIRDFADAKTIELDLFEAALTGLDPFPGMTDTQNLITIVLPQSITEIGESAFFDCNDLSRVAIKSNIIEIGSDAFSACNALTYINIPDSVVDIDTGAFSGCSSLWLNKLPDGITVLKQCVFQASGMESMPWQENPAITKISTAAFEACQSFDGIDIGGVITTIEQDAFKNAKAGWINIGTNVTSIGAGAFSIVCDEPEYMEILFAHDNVNWTLTKEGEDTVILTPDYVDPDTGECWLSPYDDEVPDTSYYDVNLYLIDKYKDYTWTKTGS